MRNLLAPSNPLLGFHPLAKLAPSAIGTLSFAAILVKIEKITQYMAS